MEQLSEFNNRESELLKLKGLKKALEQKIDKSTVLQWFASLVLTHNTIGQKNLDLFNEIKEVFSAEELKAALPRKEFNKLFPTQDNIFHCREVTASLYDLNVIELKMRTNTSAITLKYNLKNFLFTAEEVLNDRKDFVALNVRENKQEFCVELLYDSNIDTIKTKQIFETLLSSIVEIKEEIDIENLKERCYKIKSAYLLDEQLSKKDNSKIIKPKI